MVELKFSKNFNDMDKNGSIKPVVLPKDYPVAVQIEMGVMKKTKPYRLPGGTHVRPLPTGVKL